MKNVHSIEESAIEMDNIISVCCGNPQGDELPQVASAEDILIDVYSDITNAPREYAAAMFHHQYANDDDFGYENIIH
jgi:hypothetical protein